MNFARTKEKKAKKCLAKFCGLPAKNHSPNDFLNAFPFESHPFYYVIFCGMHRLRQCTSLGLCERAPTALTLVSAPNLQMRCIYKDEVREHPQAKKNKKDTKCVLFVFGAGGGIRTHVAFGQTVFKTLGQLPKSSRIVPKPPQFSAKFSLFLAPSRKFARKLRERCEKPLKTT